MENEQYIAVAEMWGYRYVADGAGKDWYDQPQPYFIKVWKDGYDEIMMPELQDKVLSWTGFGRTLAAIRGNRMASKIMDKVAMLLTQYQGEIIGTKYLFEETNLAVLEVINISK